MTDATRCIDDNDTDFEYTDANVSHKWLFRYPGKQLPDQEELQKGLTNATYVEPPKKLVATEGKRKKLLEQFYRQIIAEEIKQNVGADEVVVEPYETDYTEHYKNPDDMPLPGECLSKNEKLKLHHPDTNALPKQNGIEELKAKYPLYASTPLSYMAQITGRERFGKTQSITKSPDQNYDNAQY